MNTIIVTFVFLLCFSNGFKIKTHQKIAEAAFQDMLDSHSWEFLQQLKQWKTVFGEGAVREDCGIGLEDTRPGASWTTLKSAQLSECFGDFDGLFDTIFCQNRYFNHFHHPGETISHAGFSGKRLGFPSLRCKSSVEWAKNDDVWDAQTHKVMDSGRQWTSQGVDVWRKDWFATTAFEWTSLPSAFQYQDPKGDARRRQRVAWHLRKFFLNLGHVTHLITDLFQTQHLMNDPHAGSDFETYVDEHIDEFLFAPILPDAWESLSSGFSRQQNLTSLMEYIASFNYFEGTLSENELRTLFLWEKGIYRDYLRNVDGKAFVFLGRFDVENFLMDEFWNIRDEYDLDDPYRATLPENLYNLEQRVGASYDPRVLSKNTELQKRLLFRNRLFLEQQGYTTLDNQLATDHGYFYIGLARKTIRWILELWIQEFLLDIVPNHLVESILVVDQQGLCISGVRTTSKVLEPELEQYTHTDRVFCFQEETETTRIKLEENNCSLQVYLTSPDPYIYLKVKNSSSEQTIDMYNRNNLWISKNFSCTEAFSTFRVEITQLNMSIFSNHTRRWNQTTNVEELTPIPIFKHLSHEQVYFLDMCSVYANPDILYTTQTEFLIHPELSSKQLFQLVESHLQCPNYLEWIILSNSCINQPRILIFYLSMFLSMFLSLLYL